MTARLDYRYEPLADLWMLLIDRGRARSTDAWAPALDRIASCFEILASAPGGRTRVDMAFFGHVAEHRSVEELEEDVPPDGLLGLPWPRLVELGAEALRLAEDVYRAEVAAEREALVRDAIAKRVAPFVRRESECLAYVRERLELDDAGHVFPVILTGSIPGPGAFTSLSEATGAVCFVGVEELTGSSLIETIVHEATHAFDLPKAGPSTSVLGRLREAVPSHDVWHSLIFVQAGETIRRLVDPSHVHYGVTHTYYDRVPASKPVLEHWVRHLDGEFDTDTAIERIEAASSG